MKELTTYQLFCKIRGETSIEPIGSTHSDEHRFKAQCETQELVSYLLDDITNVAQTTGNEYSIEEARNEENNGLWYNSNNEYVWGCKNCKGEAKNLPMGYDERYHIDGKNWFSSCSNKEDLLHWYSKEDAKYLIDNGFVFTRYLAVDYHEFELETVF